MENHEKQMIIKVRTYYGKPKDVAGVPTRDGTSRECFVPFNKVVNDPYVQSFSKCGTSFDDLLDELQDRLGCQVSYLERTGDIRDLDVFEPSWPTAEQAEHAAGDIMHHVLNFVHDSHSTAHR